jgi:hypothetical protein
LFGVKKQARAVASSLAAMNQFATEWTEAPDREEFFARYLSNLGYAFYSYERGLQSLFESPGQLLSGINQTSESVKRDGRDWTLGLTARAFAAPIQTPDPRRPRGQP